MGPWILLIAALFVAFIATRRSTQAMRTRSAPPLKKDTGQQQHEKKTEIPSTHVVRAVRRHIAMQNMKPRIIMWVIMCSTIAAALWLYEPAMFLYTFRLIGPTIGIALMGVAVLGISFSFEEAHESYEFSRLGWMGAMVLWGIALWSLFKNVV